jgi:hypothetical protein
MGAFLVDCETDGKAAASCRTPKKEAAAEAAALASSHILTQNNYTTRAGTDSENHPSGKNPAET